MHPYDVEGTPTKAELALPRHWEVAGTSDVPPLLPPDSPLWDAMKPIDPLKPPPSFKDILQDRPGWRPAGEGETPGELTPEASEMNIVAGPRLWDSLPDTVTHIAGSQLALFGRYLRQRCDWCGAVLIEYDLERMAVPEGQEGLPAMWPPGALVRVDGNMSAVIEDPNTVDGQVQLPMDSCAFDPKTQLR